VIEGVDVINQVRFFIWCLEKEGIWGMKKAGPVSDDPFRGGLLVLRLTSRIVYLPASRYKYCVCHVGQHAVTWNRGEALKLNKQYYLH